MEIKATLMDLSDEGLDLLLRVGLKTDTRYIEDEKAMAALVDEKLILVNEIKPDLYSAEISAELQEFGHSAWSATASVLIRERFPDGPAFTMLKVKAPEIFKADYLDSPFGFVSKMALKREKSDKIDIWIYYPDA